MLKILLSVIEIGSEAFQGCTGLVGELQFPPFVSEIAEDTFEDCTNLTGVEKAIEKHLQHYKQWKARGIFLMCVEKR